VLLVEQMGDSDPTTSAKLDYRQNIVFAFAKIEIFVEVVMFEDAKLSISKNISKEFQVANTSTKKTGVPGS